MAYGNWGGFVFKNGERMPDWEDQPPYHETEWTAGYAQAFLSDKGRNPYHAVRGKKRVRLCGYKDSPVLFVDGQQVDLTPYKQRTPEMSPLEPADGAGEIDGYRFEWFYDSDPARVDLTLVEPDGPVWSGFSGYGMGAGYDD
ncbi:MAG: hypothetical protein OWQ57_03390 [Sulfobacillus sp.]|nr:hypothetical protein [Sulfobacillus sp.]